MSLEQLFSLEGRVAIVTGGGTHLGRAMAETIAELGARVTIVGRRAVVLDSTCAAIRGAGHWCESRVLDVTDADAVQASFTDIVQTQGRLDVLVCNAGAGFETRFPPATELAAFRATIESHLMGSFHCAHAAAGPMVARQSGAIITVASIHGSLASDPRLYAGIDMAKRSGPGYQSAKAAIIGLTRNLAAELGHDGVRVNCISPGYIPRPDADPQFVERCRERNALGTVGEAGDLRGAIALLASDAGRFMTGHNLVVDGGWSIW